MDGDKVSQAAEPIGNVAMLAGRLRGVSASEGMKTLETWPPQDVSITIPLEEPSNKKLPAAAAHGFSTNYEEERYRLESIPEWVREVNKDAYAPRYITIGPIHRGKDHDPLRRKALKEYYLNRLVQLNEPKLPEFQPLDREACLEALKKNEHETRRFYAQDFGETMKEKEWAEMLLLDGCFVVMHLLGFNFGIETITHTKWVWSVLKIDLILLENQLPFSVLECIMRFLLPKERHEDYASYLLTRMVVFYWVCRASDAHGFEVVEHLLEHQDFKDVKHLVHLIHLTHYRMIYGDKINKDSGRGIMCGLILCMWKTRSGICYLPILAMKLLSWPFMLLCRFADPEEKERKKNKEEDEGEDEDEDEDEKNIPSATEVHNLGIDFRKKYMLGPKSKYDVRINTFDNNTLDIPQLMVSSSEAPLLHNLIAWEHAGRGQNDYVEEGHFTNYAFLMYNLINKPDDIALLQRKGILLNKLGTDEEVVSYFKNLVLWNSRNPKSKPKTTTPSHETHQKKVKNVLFPKEERLKIDQVMEVLKHRVEQPEYRYWAEAKKYLSSPLQVFLVVTSLAVFVSTLLPAILSIHTTK